VATSTTAAALRDILRTLAGRYPLVDVILAPTSVQGDQAPAGIVAALRALNRWSAEREPLDTIILARGGGSIEELWAFNDERVARAIAGSAVPVITGVGHESDFTIADFAADLRGPTPTAAATLAVPDARELATAVASLAATARAQMAGRLAAMRAGVDGLSGRLARLSPTKRLAQDRQRMDDLSRREALAMAGRLRSWRERLAGQRLHLSGLDPTRILARGYAIVSQLDGTVVTSTAQVVAGDVIAVRVADGTFEAEVR
jgi:exodeoxyribonuclease VII large subunit